MKKSQEMRAKIETLKNECQTFLDEGKTGEAQAKMDEIDDLKERITLQERLEAEEKADLEHSAEGQEQQQRTHDAVREFAAVVRSGFRDALKEGTGADGGYTVPDDISTQVQQYRDTVFDFSRYVTVENVTTKEGARTYQKKATVTGFSALNELAAMSEVTGPQFERITYSIKTYGGFIPVSNQLMEDSDANIVAVLMRWFGRNSAVTRNTLIMNIIKAKTQTTITNLTGLKHILNVTLGQAYKPTSAIYVNDDGLDYLDSLEGSDGRPYLNPDPTAPTSMKLRVGANVVPIITVPNQFMPTASNIAPVIIGDLKEAITLFDRKLLSIDRSETASAGTYNAFAQNCSIFRGIEREDVVKVDNDAFVYGGIDLTAAAANGAGSSGGTGGNS